MPEQDEPSGAMPETGLLVTELRHRNAILTADLALARADLEHLQRLAGPPRSRGQRAVSLVVATLGSVDRRMTRLLEPRLTVVPGPAPTADGSPQELLRSAALADRQTVDSFGSQPASSPLLRGYRRVSRRVFATGVRAYRQARRVGGGR